MNTKLKHYIQLANETMTRVAKALEERFDVSCGYNYNLADQLVYCQIYI